MPMLYLPIYIYGKAYRKVSGRWTSPKEHVCTSPEKGYKSADQCSAVVICINKCTAPDVNTTFPQSYRKIYYFKKKYIIQINYGMNYPK